MAMAEKSTSGQEEVQTATHSSRERVIEKVEKPPVTKVDSGLGGEPETLDRAHICQLQVSDYKGGRTKVGGKKSRVQPSNCVLPTAQYQTRGELGLDVRLYFRRGI